MESHPQLGSPSVDSTDCSGDVSIGEGGSVRVRELMRTRPRTLPRDARVGELRRLFANPRVLDVLLVDGPAFVGLVDRYDVNGLPDATPAQDLAHSAGVTIAPDATLNQAMARLEETGGRRLVVVGSDGVTLEGLLCLNAKRSGFCR